MRTIFAFVILTLPLLSNGQNKAIKAASIDLQYLRDSVHIENIVEFYSYYDLKFNQKPAVRFKIKITNLGSQPIPNLNRVSNRVKFLKLYYNGEDSNDLNLGNGTEANDWPWFIEPGESEEFSTGYLLEKDAGIFNQAQPMNVTWEYMGIQSSTEIVDLVNRKIF